MLLSMQLLNLNVESEMTSNKAEHTSEGVQGCWFVIGYSNMSDVSYCFKNPGWHIIFGLRYIPSCPKESMFITATKQLCENNSGTRNVLTSVFMIRRFNELIFNTKL